MYERVRPARPGMLDRPGPWWQERLHDAEPDRRGAQPLRAVVCDDGYALYAVRPRDDDDGPAGEVVVRELAAATPAARAALWAFLLDQDLTSTITWKRAPEDEPLWLMLADPRALRRTVRDALWVRLVDVPAALAARSYAHDPDVVLELSDAFCPWNAGRFWLAGGGCEPTEARPDLALDVATLGAAYLGGADAARPGGRGARARADARRAGPRVGCVPRRHRPVVPRAVLNGARPLSGGGRAASASRARAARARRTARSRPGRRRRRRSA